MQDGNSTNRLLVFALCSLALSGLLVEVALTKFVGYKVYYHCVYAIISTVILSSGLAGTAVFLFPDWLASDNRESRYKIAMSAFLYAITLPLCVLIFCWCPLDPYNPEVPFLVRLLILPAYFVNFGIPFFFAGVCISHIFVTCKLPVRRLFFYDLIAAAVGAAIAPATLELAGGYGVVCIASALAMVAWLALSELARADDTPRFSAASISKVALFAAVSAATLMYQPWAIAKFGFDIRTFRENELKELVLNEFHGLNKTFWNVIARIDVSNEGRSANQWFTYSFAQRLRQEKPTGRMVLVDGSAPTRQFRIDGPVKEYPFIGTCLWATPYLVRPKPEPVMVIAGGGGTDILVAKYYGIGKIDVIEINPATYKNVLLGGGEEERKHYQKPLQTDKQTSVTVFNKEGRHFASTRPDGYYEVVQASAADTCTAITSGALSMAENHLYTIDAVRAFMRILKPNGVLSLSHYRSDPPTTGLRMITTYLAYLDSESVKEPWKYVLAIGDGQWCDLVMKRSPFTEEEMQRVRKWAQDTDKAIMLDPLAEGGLNRMPSEQIFDRVARAATPDARLAVEKAYDLEITPVTDDKPYFYSGHSWARSEGLYHFMFALAGVISAALVLLPLLKVGRKGSQLSMFGAGVMFALSGFAFLLFELAIMQKLTVFVGGPIYSMCVVLVSVLLGYGVGSFFAERLQISRKTFLIFAVVVPLSMVLAYFCVPEIVAAGLPLPMPARVLISVAVTVVLSMIVGMPVPTAMSAVKQHNEQAVAWMWGINCAFNGIGAMSFALISGQLGVSASFLIVAAVYLVANLIFCLTVTRLKPDA